MRLQTYTLHLPAGSVRGDGHAFENGTLVADGFSWAAFAFSVLWFLWYRLWLGALLVAGMLVVLAFAGRFLGIAPFFAVVIGILASVLIGLEASSLRRWTLARRGRPVCDAVTATSRDEAECKALARWLDHVPPRRASAAVSHPTDESVIGLFPFSEPSR